jgi:hypothetical protein
MLKLSKKENPEDDIKNYTEIKESYFDELWTEEGNLDGKLKMVDSEKFKKPKFYVRTSYLAKE